MARVLAKFAENATLAEHFGERMRMAAAGSKLETPCLEYTILTDGDAEVFEPILVQIDIWTHRAADNRAAERIVRSILSQRTSVRWDNLVLMSEYADGGFLAVPDRAGFIGRGLRFRMALLKQQFALPAH